MAKPHPDPRILQEQVRTLHRALPPIMAVHLLVGGTMVVTLRNIFPGPGLQAWGVAMLAMLLLRGLLYLHYRWHATPQTTARHCRHFLFGAALSGVLWGAAGVAFFAPTLEYQLFVLFILVGMGASAISSLTAYMPAFLAYFPISILPVVIRLLWSGQPVPIGLGLMTLGYISALSFFAHNISRSLAESWRLRFENLDLVEVLGAQKNEAEQANVAKSRFLAAASHDLRQPLHALTLLRPCWTRQRTRRTCAISSARSGVRSTRFKACSMPCSTFPSWKPARWYRSAKHSPCSRCSTVSPTTLPSRPKANGFDLRSRPATRWCTATPHCWCRRARAGPITCLLSMRGRKSGLACSPEFPSIRVCNQRPVTLGLDRRSRTPATYIKRKIMSDPIFF